MDGRGRGRGVSFSFLVEAMRELDVWGTVTWRISLSGIQTGEVESFWVPVQAQLVGDQPPQDAGVPSRKMVSAKRFRER